MATKSILKTIPIDSKSTANKLLTALVHAENKKSKEVVLSRTFEEVKAENIKQMFKKN